MVHTEVAHACLNRQESANTILNMRADRCLPERLFRVVASSKVATGHGGQEFVVRRRTSEVKRLLPKRHFSARGQSNDHEACLRAHATNRRLGHTQGEP